MRRRLQAAVQAEAAGAVVAGSPRHGVATPCFGEGQILGTCWTPSLGFDGPWAQETSNKQPAPTDSESAGPASEISSATRPTGSGRRSPDGTVVVGEAPFPAPRGCEWLL